MAWMIPERIPAASCEVEQEAFKLLRRFLPAECAVWHKSALELEKTEQVPFLALGDEIGIAVIHPFGWDLTEAVGNLADFWKNPKAPQLGDTARVELQACQQRALRLHRLLLDSRLPALVVDGGRLRPAWHKVYVLARYTGKDVNRLNLRGIADDGLVLGRDEVSQLHHILRQHTPQRAHLTGQAFNAVRLVISPSVEIAFRPGRRTTPTVEGDFRPRASATPLMLDLRQEQVVKSFAHLPPEHEHTARDLDARLIRGVVGSGKSLILLHRANFLSQLNPRWRVLLLTYNRSLADFLNNRLADLPGPSRNVEIINFHKWCRRFLYDAGLWRKTDLDDRSRKGLLVRLRSTNRSSALGDDLDYILEEFDWIRDQGFTRFDEYADIVRRGRQRRLFEAQRREVWNLLQRFRAAMRKNDQFDWPEVPLMMLEGMRNGQIRQKQYHAILVDEAQDFGPSWFTVVQQMLRPTTNMLFIVADAAQKIYRRPLSWRALGIDVTGRRSRILSRSYRNTYEILRVAYQIVGNDEDLREEIRSEGEDVIEPDLDSRLMRRGPLPVIMQFSDPTREMSYIAQETKRLKEKGFGWDEIAVIHRESAFLRNLASYLRAREIPVQVVGGVNIDLGSPDVKLLTLHSSKGLEFSVVFVAGVERLQPRPGLTAEELSSAMAEQRRLLYVGMTRARERLHIMHAGPLPLWVGSVLADVEDSVRTGP